MIKHFQQIIHHRSESVLEAAIITALITLGGSLLGIIRNALLAGKFGASASLDVYYAAFRIPDFIYNIFIIGIISAAFVPIFSEYWHRNKEQANDFANGVIILIGGIGILFALVVMIFARPLGKLFFPGFSSSQLNLAILMTRIMMIQPLLMGVSSVIGNILKIFKLFFISALAPLMYNLGIIIGILYFVPYLGVKGLAWGVVLGAAMHLLIQLSALPETHLKLYLLPQAILKIKAGINKMLKMAVPRLLAIINAQVFLLGTTAVATTLQKGSLAIFNFAFAIQNLPQSIFAMSFTVAAFPKLSSLYAQAKQKEFNQLTEENILQILFFLVPIGIWFIIFREPIVRLLLGYGKFDWQATVKTTQVLSLLVWGMIFQGISLFLLRVFFSQKDVIHPFQASLIAYGLGLAMVYFGARYYGLLGLALAFSFTYILYFIMLSLLVSPQYFKGRYFRKACGKIVIVSLIGGGVAQILFSIFRYFFSLAQVKIMIGGFLFAFVPSLIIFLYLSSRWHIDQLDGLKLLLRKYWHGKR